jgi:hypothetical protein
MGLEPADSTSVGRFAIEMVQGWGEGAAMVGA